MNIMCLHQLSRNCEFHNVDGEIKSQMIQCCISSRLRRNGLKTADISLEQLLDDARALEISEVQASGIEVNTVNSVSNQRGSKYHRKTKLQTPGPSLSKIIRSLVTVAVVDGYTVVHVLQPTDHAISVESWAILANVVAHRNPINRKS